MPLDLAKVLRTKEQLEWYRQMLDLSKQEENEINIEMNKIDQKIASIENNKDLLPKWKTICRTAENKSTSTPLSTQKKFGWIY